jgi:hypothetical protein
MTLEDVIKGLECCSKGDCADCDNCTYHGVQTDVPCESTLMRDALVLLKAQEPRVLTLDELRMNEVYWAEQDNILRPWPITLHHIRNAGLLDGPVYQDWMGENYNTKEYGRKWRCWTSRPDQATREATPWQV